MTKKNSFILLLVSIFILLTGCGAEKTIDESGVIEEVFVEEAFVEEAPALETEVEETVEKEILEENTDEIIEDIIVPKWYLDEEGLKNEELNWNIKRNESIMDQQIDVTLSVDGKELPFYCSNSDDNLDEYISQREKMQKGQIENIEFAYDDMNIIFIGNGIEIRSNYFFWGLEEGTNVVEWLKEKNIIKALEVPLKECMAYSTKDGLYCPAMGIAICKEGAVDGTSSIGVSYSYKKGEEEYASISISNRIDRSVIGSAVDAQEAISNIKKYFGEEELNWINNDMEVNIGNDKIIGTGFDRGDTFIFFMYPENLTYDIDIFASNEQACVNALSIVEKLKEDNSESSIIEDSLKMEAAKENDIPKGVDIESTLPGEQWLESFVGIVEEPIVVIFNDNTGRKEVVQANSTVTVNPDEDKIGIYLPEHKMGLMGSTTHAISVKEFHTISRECEIIEMDAKKMRDIPERNAKVTFRNDKEEWDIEFTILVN
ncbi:MAG: hypothetical protein J6J79_08220 [Lachnospiraceae bacterium]|mgnify:CR=1 FL=1|nr:hypothetical protein [Lachnospiraceae bacterium]